MKDKIKSWKRMPHHPLCEGWPMSNEGLTTSDKPKFYNLHTGNAGVLFHDTW